AGMSDDGGVASDCARQFFLRFAECFRPAGTCSSYTTNSYHEACWEDGAFERRLGLISPTSSYGMNGRRCLVEFAHFAGTTGVDRYCVSSANSECGADADLGSTPVATYDGVQPRRRARWQTAQNPVGGLDVSALPTYTFRQTSTGWLLTLTDPGRG